MDTVVKLVIGGSVINGLPRIVSNIFIVFSASIMASDFF